MDSFYCLFDVGFRLHLQEVGSVGWGLFIYVSLSDFIFETGAYRVPSKSQNRTVLGHGGPSVYVYSASLFLAIKEIIFFLNRKTILQFLYADA